MYNKILLCCYGNGITDEKIQDLSLIMAMYGCLAVCLYGDLLFKIPSSFMCAPRAPHHANFAGQCVNINAMADTPALGSQETRNRLGLDEYNHYFPMAPCIRQGNAPLLADRITLGIPH